MMTHPLRWLFLVASIVLLTISISAHAQIVPVMVKAGESGEAAGVLTLRSGNCEVLTVAHVISQNVRFKIQYKRENQTASIDWNGATDSDHIDIALLRLEKPSSASCDSLPEIKTIDDALRQNEGKIWWLSDLSEISTTPVEIARRSDSQLFLSYRQPNHQILSEGISGAPVVFGGIVVGIITGIDNNGLIAERIDYLLSTHGAALGIRPMDQAMAPAYQPFDVSQLPLQIAEQVQKARDVKLSAEDVARVAKEIERRSDDAARAADALRLDEVSEGVSKFSTDGSPARFYRGQALVTTSMKSGRGYGTLTIESGQTEGDVVKCNRAESGCVGPTIFEFPRHSSVWQKLEVDMKDNLANGPGVLYFKNGNIFWGTFVTKEIAADNTQIFSTGYGVLREPDGSVYEGEVDGAELSDKLGARWNADGSLDFAGRFDHGSPHPFTCTRESLAAGPASPIH